MDSRKFENSRLSFDDSHQPFINFFKNKKFFKIKNSDFILFLKNKKS